MGWISGACQLPYAVVRSGGAPTDDERDENDDFDGLLGCGEREDDE
ncbi:hypothetical protein [Prauserella aidingensis]|nr:hypothetical protein [Prauserella aidingensis]